MNNELNEIKEIISQNLKGVLQLEIDSLAKELIKYYQPRIPEDSVVLTRAEYDDMFSYQTMSGPDKRCGFYNILDTVRKVEREEVASSIYLQLKLHGPIYTQKWIKDNYKIEV